MSRLTNKTGAVAGGLAGLILAAGAFVAVPATANAASTTQSFKVTVTESCTLSFFGTQNLKFVYQGKVPKTVAPGKDFSITSQKTTIDIPGSLSSAAWALGVRKGEGAFSNIDVDQTNGTPATVDLIPSPPYSTGMVPFKDGKPIALPAPSTGTFTVKDLQGTAAGSLLIQAGAMSGTFSGYDSGGNPVFTDQPMSCSAPSPDTTLATITVS
jgi:hypothetical protein